MACFLEIVKIYDEKMASSRMQKILLVVAAGAMVATSALGCAERTEAEKYARLLDLPKEDRVIVRQLEYDCNTRLLLRELYYLPEELQIHEVTLSYLREVAQDKKVSDEEYCILYYGKLDHDGDGLDLDMENKLKTNPLVPDPEVKDAVETLKSVSDKTLEAYLELGIDANAVQYISFISSLPQDFAHYALGQKLCFQDKKLTDLERSFLNEPEQYLREMYDYYISEISKIDSELAAKVEELPYFKELETEDIEVLEDVLFLANNPEYESTLENLYGKGIERKMHPVALEALLWRGFNKEFDLSNPLEGADLRILNKLADFQKKYNKEMNMEGVGGTKPAVRGTELFYEPLQYWIKDEDELRFDYALIRWVLRCNAVKLWGCNEKRWKPEGHIFHHLALAQEEGLDVWLNFFPAFHPYPDTSLTTYKKWLAEFAAKAQQLDVKGLWVGTKLDLFSKAWGGYDGHRTQPGHPKERLANYIDELVDIARQNYSGPISYSEANWWDPVYAYNVHWNNMDFISFDMTIGRSYIGRTVTDKFYVDSLLQTKKKYTNPLFASELKCLSVSGAEIAGGDAAYPLYVRAHHDPEKQAQVMDRELCLLWEVGIDGVFAGYWDAPAQGYGKSYDMNRLGFGIWDHVKKEPKPSFWTVYKYYKE